MQGTITAIGIASVTIRTRAGTTTYGVTSSSEIDKDGKDALRDLAVGDAVTFRTMTTDRATTIVVLHAGSERRDRPQRGVGLPPGFALRGAPLGSSVPPAPSR